jgi:D-xylose 1-dehydrogenase (NADP+, D-xylono-1,5-lactone-forming)
MPRDTEIRWGVLGAGWIAQQATLDALAFARNGHITAIASRDSARSRALAARYEIPTIHESYQALIEDPAVDAIYLSLVGSLHAEWTLLALANGKHVLCEKPLARSLREATEMAEAAKRADRHLMEAFMYRFHPDVLAFVADIKDARYVHAEFAYSQADSTNFRLRAELGGGAIYDMGCYIVNHIRWLMGEPESAVALASVDGVDRVVGATLRFPEGGQASFWTSFFSEPRQWLHAITPDGVHQTDRPFIAWREPGRPDYPLAAGPSNPYQTMVEAFAESILTSQPSPLPIADSLGNARALDMIRGAAGLVGTG